MSIDKEEMDEITTKLAQTEEDLAQANREVQAYKENVCVCVYMCMCACVLKFLIVNQVIK